MSITLIMAADYLLGYSGSCAVDADVLQGEKRNIVAIAKAYWPPQGKALKMDFGPWYPVF